MAEAQRTCWIEQHDGEAVLHLGGAWRLAALRDLSRQLGGPDGVLQGAPGAVDGAALQHIDTAAALLLLNALAQAGADPQGVVLRRFEPHHQRVLEAVALR